MIDLFKFRIYSIHMGKAEIKKLQKEKALLDAAYSLFLKNGIKGTSISDITEKAGVAKGTFYLYFKDKTDIRDRLVATKAAEVFSNAYRELKKSGKDQADVADQVLFLIQQSVEQLSKNTKLMQFIAANLEWTVLSKAIVRNENEKELSVVDAYQILLSRVKERYRNVEIMLFMIIELTTATVYNAAVHGKPVSIGELKPELFRTIETIMESFRIEKD